ncbi:MAG: ferrous iron transport protein B [Bacteroidales bacterium]|nr:ferrous iron transport protein B [Bacteroidales bacterium]
MKLSELRTGERGVIVKVNGHGGFRKRIKEMGFVKGNKVKVILNAPLRDPIEYEIIGYKISLRREQARQIEVISEAEAKLMLSAQENLTALKGDDEYIERLAAERRKVIKVALVGNPNCGKTSLFNMASGSHEHVGNYSGVTVDAKEGVFEHGGYRFVLTDLPGTYSLSAYSPEELYVRKNLIEDMPDVVINVVDASNLQRNLYLTTQLIDMNLRVVMALNMYDELTASGDSLDIRQLGYLLGMPIVPTVSRTGEGVGPLFDIVIKIYEQADPHLARHIHINHGAEVEQSIDRIKALISKTEDIRYKYSTRYLAIKYLENDKEIEGVVESLDNRDEIIAARFEENTRIRGLMGSGLESSMVDAKYAFVQGALAETYQRAKNRKRSSRLTDRIDAVVTNRWLAFPVFFLLLYIVFDGTFVLGEYPMRWIEWLVGHLGAFVGSAMADGWFKDLIVDGVIGGVGSVLVFLPNILLLYLFISLLEDSGYMARAAFIMDRLMHRIGLHGKSFIPMIMGFGCNVPAVMATRTIESHKSRLITMLIIPLMSCAGRMPVYILLAGAFFPNHAGLVLLGLYALGIGLAILAAKIMSRFFKEDDLPFVMELPPYRIPTARSIFRHTWEKGRQYLQKMSGVILIFSVVLWFLSYFPNHDSYDTVAQQQEHSFIGYVGKAIEPVLEPLGFDWRMGVGIVAGVGAKELVVSTLGVMYTDISEDGSAQKEEGAANVSEESDTGAYESDYTGDTRLQRELLKSVSPAGALAYMVFILLYFPCIATFIAIKNESGGWKWAIYTAIYTIFLAWIAAFATFHIASLF